MTCDVFHDDGLAGKGCGATRTGPESNLNAIGGGGYWYNAGTLIGLRKRLERRRRAKWEKERVEWEIRQYWKEVNENVLPRR